MNETLWFVPACIVVLCMALAYALTDVDNRYGDDLKESWPKIFEISSDGARGILEAIATSMITVAGVTFSITVVTLSLAANQYTPRILRNFTRDRGNQFVLGVFVGVFAYSVVVLRMVRTGEVELVPAMSVLVGILLAILGVGVLIYFVHHVAESIQASYIVSSVARETTTLINELAPEAERDPGGLQSDGGEGQWTEVPSEETGYIQGIDVEGLVKFASSRKLLVRIDHGVGSFIVRGSPLAYVNGGGKFGQEDESEINSRIEIDHYRSINQDISFGIRQIVDIALRALSPSDNDTSTAITCVNYLTGILHHFACRYDPQTRYYDKGTLCVLTNGARFETLLDEAFDPVRYNAASNPEVLLKMLSGLQLLLARVDGEDRRRAIFKHVRLIQQAADRAIEATYERERIEAMVARIS